MFYKILALAVAGGLGSLSRYGLSGVVQRAFGAEFPWGTFVVNMTGCFVFGVVWAFCQDRLSVSPEVRTVVLVGFMGAFTTFSSYIFETNELLRESLWLKAVGNVLGQNIAGVVCLLIGMAIGRLF
jgi:fluoride exporter